MPADIKLGDGARTEWVTVEGHVLKVEGSDVMLDSPARRQDEGGHRRALVHDGEDGLTINFNGDYPGGVRINDARLNIRCVVQGMEPQLPSVATPGDVLFIFHQSGDQVSLSTSSLWICVKRDLGEFAEAAKWQQIALGDPVDGTA